MGFLLLLGLAGVIFALGFLACLVILKANGRIKGAYDDDIAMKKLERMRSTWMSLKTVVAKCQAGESEKYLLALSKDMDEHLNTKDDL